MNKGCHTVRCFIREATVQRANTATTDKRTASRIRWSVHAYSVRATSSDGELGSPSTDSLTHPRQSRGRPAATGAMAPAVRQAPLRLTYDASTCLSSTAVQMRTVCHTFTYVTNLTVLSIPAPQRVPRRREKQAPEDRRGGGGAQADDRRPSSRAPRRPNERFEYGRGSVVVVRLRRELRNVWTPPKTCDAGQAPRRPACRRGGAQDDGSYLVDPASSHMLVSKIKPCMSKHKPLHGEAANGSLGHP
jgi:hypothetical protein